MSDERFSAVTTSMRNIVDFSLELCYDVETNDANCARKPRGWPGFLLEIAMSDDHDPYLTPTAARDMLAEMGVIVSLATIYKYLKKSEIPARRIGGKKLYVRRSDLMEWIAMK